MKSTTTRLSMLSLMLAASGAQAQAPAPALPAQLVAAAQKAVTSNPEVQARWNGFLAADNEREFARGGLFPQIDLQGSAGRASSTTPLTDYGRYNVSGARISLNQMLFDGGFLRNESKRLGYAKLTRYYELAEISEAVALEAVRAYADVLRYRELVEMAKENYAEHKRTVVQVEERANSGVGRRVDVEQAIGRLALAESNLLIELNNLHDVSARYLRIMGERPPANLAAMPEKFKIGTMPATGETMLRTGLQNSPTINAALENLRAFQQAIESRKAAFMPRLDLRAFQSTGQNTAGLRGETRNSGVELVVNYNLYRGGADSAARRQTINQKDQARELLEKACRDVRQTLAIAYREVSSLAEQLAYQDQHRLSTEKSREAYRQQFDLGQRTLLDLLDSQNEYFTASRAYINTRYTQIASQARVLSGMGQLVSVLGANRPDQPSAPDAGQTRTGIEPSETCPIDETTVESVEKIKADTVISLRARPAPPLAPAAPVAAATPAPAAQTTKIRLSADVLFDFDNANLKPAGKSRLDSLVGDLKGRAVDVMIVTGHTDSIGSAAYNKRLSIARAETVKAHLVAKGIDVARIRTMGAGATEPVATNATAEGRSKNRRVDIEVAGKGEMPKAK